MQSFAWFLAVSCLHFLLSVVGTVLSLRAAFDTQGSFWEAPSEATLAYLSAILLAPLRQVRQILPAEWQGGYGEIATVSVLFGAVAVGLLHLMRVVRLPRTR